MRQRALPDTPEGQLDAQTALGRRPAASTAAGAVQGVPTVAFVGGLGPGAPVDLLREARVRPSAASAKAADALRPGAAGWARAPPPERTMMRQGAESTRRPPFSIAR